VGRNFNALKHVLNSTHALRIWSWSSLAYFVVVVLGGAVVRATGAGAGCGDRWPLCNGEFIPHHPRLTTVIEFTHRSTTFVAVLLFTVMIVGTFYATPKKHAARQAAIWSAVLLVTESILGAVLVLWHLVEKNTSTLRVFVQSIHFTNTMLLLAAVTLTAIFLKRQDKGIVVEPNLRSISLATLMATLLTGATGALAALADTIFPPSSFHNAILADLSSTSPILIHMRWLHPACVIALVICCLVLIQQYRKLGQSMAAFGLACSLTVQVLVGVADVFLLAPMWVQIMHLLVADFFWILLVAITAPAVFSSSHPRRIPTTVWPFQRSTIL
jgi:heme a synthase